MVYELIEAIYGLIKAIVTGFEGDAVNDFEAFEAFLAELGVQIQA